jgi:hypothetical protein
VAVDCADPARLVRFWADALGYRIEDPPDGFDRAVALAVRKQRVDAEVDRLIRAGATRLPAPEFTGGMDHYFVPMLDPEGNEFDVV